MMDLSRHPLRVLPIPTGEFIEFRALSYPLPEAHRDVLKGLHGDDIDVYVSSLRKAIGINFYRRKYTFADGLRALQRNGESGK